MPSLIPVDSSVPAHRPLTDDPHHELPGSKPQGRGWPPESGRVSASLHRALVGIVQHLFEMKGDVLGGPADAQLLVHAHGQGVELLGQMTQLVGWDLGKPAAVELSMGRIGAVVAHHGSRRFGGPTSPGVMPWLGRVWVNEWVMWLLRSRAQ